MRCRADAIIAVSSLLLTAALPAIADAGTSARQSSDPRGGASATTPIPTGSASGSGGAGVTITTAGSGAATATVVALPGSLPTTVTGNGFTMTTQASAQYNRSLLFSGAVDASGPGSGVAVQRFDKTYGWTTVAEATVGLGGTFSATWKTNHTGLLAMRAISLPIGANGTPTAPTAATASARTQTPPTGTTGGTGTTGTTGATSTSGGASWSLPTGTPTPSGSPAVDVTVYKTWVATQYGPGFFGHRTACGETLRKAMIGVASRTLRCGTQVALYYNGSMLVAPVIDRGPYANGASWDLTVATAKALGVTGTATIGAQSLNSH
jgi:hypothetical protein